MGDVCTNQLKRNGNWEVCLDELLHYGLDRSSVCALYFTYFVSQTWEGPEHKDQLNTIERKISKINKEAESTGKMTQDQRGTKK